MFVVIKFKTEAVLPPKDGEILLGAHVSPETAERFRDLARANGGNVSAELRSMVMTAVHGRGPAPPPGATGYSVMVRLKDAERIALLQAAQARSTTPSNWLRSLAIAHLGRRPQWAPTEVEALREVFAELRRIGNNVNQIARALNVAELSGEYPPSQGDAARDAVGLVRVEMRRIGAVLTGNFDYWGLPDAERPTSAMGALERDKKATDADHKKRRTRPRHRPTRFAKEGDVG